MTISLDVEDDLPHAMVDARALELASINLIDNAFKYAKDGARVEVSVTKSEGKIRVRVRDHGPGIDGDDRERIFERFFRGKNASGTQVRGSGIGLALVKHIAESHGGSIRVESPVTSPVEADKGCAFIIEIPALAVIAARGSGSRASHSERERIGAWPLTAICQ